MQAFHWLVGAGVVTCVATVKLAQWTEDKKKKGQYMLIHKSTALLVAALVVPRVLLRLVSKVPGPVPNASKLEQVASSTSHFALYALMIGLPATGIAMGYFGGKGLPFFGAHIAGAAEPNKDVAKNAFKFHKKMGQVLEYLIPLHIAGTVFHMFQGVSMFTRMGFALSPTPAATSAASSATALILASADNFDSTAEVADNVAGEDEDEDEAEAEAEQ